MAGGCRFWRAHSLRLQSTREGRLDLPGSDWAILPPYLIASHACKLRGRLPLNRHGTQAHNLVGSPLKTMSPRLKRESFRFFSIGGGMVGSWWDSEDEAPPAKPSVLPPESCQRCAVFAIAATHETLRYRCRRATSCQPQYWVDLTQC